MSRTLRNAALVCAAAGLALTAAAPQGIAAKAVRPYAIQPVHNVTFIQASKNIAPSTGGDDFLVTMSTTSTGAFKIPFTLRPYGEARTSMVVSSNGNIQFPGKGTDPNVAWTNACLPTHMPSPFIAPYWDDLQFAATGTVTPNEGIYVKTIGTAPHRKFIVNWRGHLFGQDTAATRFGVIFYEGVSKISFQYLDNTAASATIGTQDRPATTSTQWTCDSGGTSVQTGLRLDFIQQR